MPTPIIERAFQLANTGEYASMGELKLVLGSEGYSQITAYLTGRSITAQLRKTMLAATRRAATGLP